MKKQELIQIARTISDKLKKHPKIDLILIHGSIPENMSDKYSDIDLQIYTKKLDVREVKEIFNLLDLHYENQNPPFFRAKTKKKGIEISLCFNPVSVYNDIPNKNDTLNPFLDENLQMNIVSFVLNTIVLFDRNNLFKKYNKLKELPSNFQRHYLTFEFNKLLDYFKENSESFNLNEKRKNKLAVIRAFEQSNRRIFKILYALNGKFLLNEKWVYKYVEKFSVKPKDCLKRLENMMALGFDQFSEKKKLYGEFIKDLQPIIEKKLKV
jgi:predicted nucleotidyltransferase